MKNQRYIRRVLFFLAFLNKKLDGKLFKACFLLVTFLSISCAESLAQAYIIVCPDTPTSYNSYDEEGITNVYYIRLMPSSAGNLVEHEGSFTVEWSPTYFGKARVSVHGQKECTPKERENGECVDYLYESFYERIQTPNPSANIGSLSVPSFVDLPSGQNTAYVNVTWNPPADYPVKDIDYVQIEVDGVFQTKDGSPSVMSLKLSSYGARNVKFIFMAHCGVKVMETSATIEVRASCYGDNLNYALSATGGTIKETEPIDGKRNFTVDKGTTIQFDFPEVSDFNEHYYIEHNGEDNVTSAGTNAYTIHAEKASITFNVGKNKDRIGCPEGISATINVGGEPIVFENMEQLCPILLPDALIEAYHITYDDPALQHFTTYVKSERGIIVKPGLTLTQGAELVLDTGLPDVITDNNDLDKNFVHSTTYDEYGRVISQSRQYFNEAGKATQAQTKNFAEGVVLASETLYDAYGRAVINTLPAPVAAVQDQALLDECGEEIGMPLALQFAYKPGFVTDPNGQPYDPTDFDMVAPGLSLSSDAPNIEENPKPVGNTQEGTLGWYYSDNNGKATNQKLNEDFVPTTAFPYSRTLYHRDGTGEVKGAIPPGDVYRGAEGLQHVGSTKNLSVENSDPYLVQYFKMRGEALPGLSVPVTYQGNFFTTVSIDGEGNKAVSYTDKGGVTIMALYFGKQISPISKSYSFYDDAGRLKAAVTPNGVEQYERAMNPVPYAKIDKTTYEYNYKGWLLAINEPDAGRSEYVYRKDGSIRFSQNAEQRNDGRYSYTHYDPSGRPVESGEYKPHTSGGIAFKSTAMQAILEDVVINTDAVAAKNSGGLPDASGIKTDRIFTTYDEPATALPAGRVQRFVQGAPAFTKNNHVTTYYSYDELGRVEWMVQDIAGLGIKTLDYRYGPTGAVQEVTYQKGQPDHFTHYYNYDEDGRLKEAHTATTELTYNVFGELENKEALTQQAVYEYYLHGPLKRVELGNKLQGIDYVYTIQGWLKSLNHPIVGKDPGKDGSNGVEADVFGMTLEYFSGDYVNMASGISSLAVAEPQYNGNIAAMSWKTSYPSLPDVPEARAYGYEFSYDERQQLKEASWRLPDFQAATFQQSANENQYKEKVAAYDLNGNIQGLQRYDQSSIEKQLNYDYAYEDVQSPKYNNQLKEVGGYSKYEYDSLGQLRKEDALDGRPDQFVRYDVSGKVISVYSQAQYDADQKTWLYKEADKVFSYTYDDRGFRLMKRNHQTGKETWYVRDASGQLMSIYEKEPNGIVQQAELPVYGAGRLGQYYRQSQEVHYELKDHLGNVRATVSEKEGAGATSYETLIYTYTMEGTSGTGIDGSKPSIQGEFEKAINFGRNDNYSILLTGTPYIQFSVAKDEKVNVSLWASKQEGYGVSARIYFYDLDMIQKDMQYATLTENIALWQYISVPEVLAMEDGYIRIELDPEEQGTFVDDLVIVHEKQVSERVEVQSYADYYPFGSTLRRGGKPGRYGYQGDFAEDETDETGWNSFELRQYDPVVGRWTSVDPKRQYASSYVGMGNNPINGIDPDGGEKMDVIIKGKNNSSYTISAPGDHIYLYAPFDFGGHKLADFSLDYVPDISKILVGYEIAGEIGGGFIVGGDMGPRAGAFMMFGGEYSLYWYPYVGYETKLGEGADFGLDASVNMSIFVGINKTGNYHPSTFSGEAWIVGGGVGVYHKVGGQLGYSKSFTEHWDIHTISFGVGVGERYNFFNIRGGIGAAGILSPTGYSKTADRPWYDILSNHLMFNPLSPIK